MASKTYYYGRVSSTGQNLARQIEAFRALGASERDIITDKQSGKDTDRIGYQSLKQHLLREGDTLVVKSLDRLSRNKSDIAQELLWFRKNSIRLKIIDIPTTMIEFPTGQEWVLDMVNNILFEVLSTIAQQERETIRQRQAEGIAAMPIGSDGKRHSMKTGRAVGRPCLKLPDNWDTVYEKWQSGEITAQQAMEQSGMKKSSFYKAVSQMQQ